VITMVGQVVAAAAPTVIQSATNEDGLINRLFKLVLIGATIATALAVAVVLFLAFNIWEAVGGSFSTITGGISAGLSVLPGIGPLFAVFTGLFSAFTR